MNKLFLTTLTVVVCVAGASAQSKTQQGMTTKSTLDPAQVVGRAAQGGARVDLWSNDFSEPSDWTLVSDGLFEVNWQVGTDLVTTGNAPIATILSPTAANGYAMLDSDVANNNTGEFESSHMTVGPIDLSGYPNVALEFQTFYRKWTNEECYVVISTNNTDWPALDPTSTDGGPLPNVYEVFPGMATQEIITNPDLVRINISDAAGDQPQVWIRFHWTGIFGYAWFVDDVAVVEQPPVELIMENGFLTHTGLGEEYGRIPSGQLNPDMTVGGDFLNFGIQDQTEVAVALEVRDASNALVFDANSTPISLASGASSSMNEIVVLPALSPGVYNGTFTASSAENGSDDDLSNNVYLRNFEVTTDLYSLDGIGNHPPGYENLGSFGTSSFADAPDGVALLTYYQIREELTVYGLEILLNSATTTGGFVIASIHDTASVIADDVTNFIDESQPIDVTQADIDAGRMRIFFDVPVTLSPEGYYAGVTMYSNNGAGPIRIVDDLTVPQPSGASVVYDPIDMTTFSNGNALAIRLLMSMTVGEQDQHPLDGVSMYPNPTNGILNITTPVFDGYTVEVVDMLGKTVMASRANGNTTLDLRAQPKGMYAVRISSAQGSVIERVTLD